MCIHFIQDARTLNAKIIYCGHNAVVEVCTMLDIKGISLFIEKFNLLLLAHYIYAYCESVYVKSSNYNHEDPRLYSRSISTYSKSSVIQTPLYLFIFKSVNK